MFTGGIADKLGNRYEASWLIRQLLDVIGGKADWLKFEGIDDAFRGFEFAVGTSGTTAWHQTKTNAPNGNWTISALQRENVLLAFKRRLSAGPNERCIFLSQDPANDLRELSEKAVIATSADEFQASLGKGHTAKFTDLVSIWQSDAGTAYDWLKRSEFLTLPLSQITAYLETFSSFYFATSPDIFAILREFAEARINKVITTENARDQIRAARRLTLKDWALDPTLREKLANETQSYLDSYTPFGVGGDSIERPEARAVFDLIQDPLGPKVIVLSGAAGSGKSGVVREVLAYLRQQGICHLAFRVDHHLECRSTQAFGEALTGRAESPGITLKGVAPDKTSVLIVDQIDAVSEVSGRNGAVRRAVLRLADEIWHLATAKLVFVCRSFDLETDERFRKWKDTSDFSHIDVPPLTWEDVVEPLLISKSIPSNNLSQSQKALLCLPLNLAIFVETFDESYASFANQNELFAKLLHKKEIAVRETRQPGWPLIAPLSRAAESMSERQRLDSPQEVLAEFDGAIDILASENMIVRSRGRFSFFHESFFDFIYARTFSARQLSLTELLCSSEQHLFRRTQVRQILETLRQVDRGRYLTELSRVLDSKDVRYHIKIAVTQWLGILTDPTADERKIILRFDTGTEGIPPLLRNVLFSSPAWFDVLSNEDWVFTNLCDKGARRADEMLYWLSFIVSKRPQQVARLLTRWLDDFPQSAEKILDWFHYVREHNSEPELIDLCSRVMTSNPEYLFASNAPNRRSLLVRKWANRKHPSAATIIRLYFRAWFAIHPDEHMFASDQFRQVDQHTLEQVAKTNPIAFVEGSVDAFAKSVKIVAKKRARGEYDPSFRDRTFSGHHFRADAFLAMFRTALKKIAASEPDAARRLLDKIDARKEEVFTHLWLEVISANAKSLSDLLVSLIDNPHLLTAGWKGAEWRSFADAARSALPHLSLADANRLLARVNSDNSDLFATVELAHLVTREGESAPWQTRKTVISHLNHRGYKQWCILEHIGEAVLGKEAQSQLNELRRKFPEAAVSQPLHNEAHWVGPPIKHESAERMTDSQWLRAIERYQSDDERHIKPTSIEGGAWQLAAELKEVARKNPDRFARLLERIPDEANTSYISQLLRGLGEGDAIGAELIRSVISDAHGRPGRPYGTEISLLFTKYAQLASEDDALQILFWYLENGSAEQDRMQNATVGNEAFTIEELLHSVGGLHERGINSERGAAAEAIGSILWEVPQIPEAYWLVLERRANEEELASVRCSLVTAIVALYNHDRIRCAKLLERLSLPPGHALDHAHLQRKSRVVATLAFPRSVWPAVLKWPANVLVCFVGRFVLPSSRTDKIDPSALWLSPLVTQHGTYLISFLIPIVSTAGNLLVSKLLVSKTENFRLIGAWHVFRSSFHDSRYASMSEVLARRGVAYRRLFAGVAAQFAVQGEFRHRAEQLLRIFFDDEDSNVRVQAADVFSSIDPRDFGRFKDLALSFVSSRAFSQDSSRFFSSLEGAECEIENVVIAASERLVSDIELNGNAGGRRSMDLHSLEDILRDQYASSEQDITHRKRILDVIDRMLSLELDGVDTVIRAHERGA